MQGLYAENKPKGNLTSGEKEKDFKTPYLQEIIYSQDNTQGFHEPNHITQKNLFFKIQINCYYFCYGKMN